MTFHCCFFGVQHDVWKARHRNSFRFHGAPGAVIVASRAQPAECSMPACLSSRTIERAEPSRSTTTPRDVKAAAGATSYTFLDAFERPVGSDAPLAGGRRSRARTV